MDFKDIILLLIAIFLFVIMKLQFAKWYKHWNEENPSIEYWIIFIATMFISTIIVCALVWLFGKGFGLI